jgi:hypothetical protein
MELEKEDILANYRDAHLEIEQLNQGIEALTNENREFYV